MLPVTVDFGACILPPLRVIMKWPQCEDRHRSFQEGQTMPRQEVQRVLVPAKHIQRRTHRDGGVPFEGLHLLQGPAIDSQSHLRAVSPRSPRQPPASSRTWLHKPRVLKPTCLSPLTDSNHRWRDARIRPSRPSDQPLIVPLIHATMSSSRPGTNVLSLAYSSMPPVVAGWNRWLASG